MAKSALVDAGFLVALLSRRDANHGWAAAQAPRLLGALSFASLLRRGALVCDYRFADDMDAVLKLLEKYADVPMSFADACLVRMTETLNDPVLLTTDGDFRIYRRHGRQIIPCVLPR